jgi:NAD(P)-dependent dehydrogenase (short-subunit alcohol dehydrogenase family)
MAYPGLGLEGRSAVVLGGTSGIGRAIAIGFAKAGADVAAVSRREVAVAAAADEIEQHGRRVLRQTADVTDRPSLERLLDAAIAVFGKVDILVNCAGRHKRSPTLDVSEEEFSGVLETNLTGTLRACQIFGRHMIERGYGRIVNIGSLASFVGFVEVTPYTASKAGVAGLTRSLAIEWGARGVLVNAIAPGGVVSPHSHATIDQSPLGEEVLPRTPLGRFGELEELVGPAIFLASEAASFVNGHILAVDGGFLASGMNQ